MGTGLLVGAVGATLASPAAALFPSRVPSSVAVLLFPMFGVLGFAFALVGYLLLRDLHLPTDPFLGIVLVLGLNALASLIFLSPTLLNAGCEGVYPPRPCGYGIVACRAWIVSVPVTGILLWIGVRRLRRLASLSPPAFRRP